MRLLDAYDAYFMGSFNNETEFWDCVLDEGRPAMETNRAKRTLLYPVFKKDAKYIGDFELNIAVDAYLNNKKNVLERIAKEIEIKKRKEYRHERIKDMNRRFSNLFNLVEV